ncbi:MAG TPA: CPBP family intramembrane glutamic endopeptidase [Spirochaetia bacterium]|nr:CPBP family intramembrane glutamic endopeptidase [Spirochaetia bacterium]
MPRSSIRPWPLVLFVLISYGIVWILVESALVLHAPLLPLLVVGSWAPNIAAVFVLGVVLREKGGIRALFGRWLRWGFPARWYLAALTAPALAFLSIPLFLLFGGSLAASTLGLGSVLMLVVVEIVTGATGEEPGWRGFLQLRLQEGLTPLVSGIIVGVVWAFFHLPLWLVPGGSWAALPFWAFGLSCLSASVVFAWLVNGAGGSTVIASIFHFFMNVSAGLVGLIGMPIVPLYKIYAILLTILAVVVGLLMEAARRKAVPSVAASSR